MASSEATASEASASEVGGATAAKPSEQGGSDEAANEGEEDRDVWRRRNLRASGSASQAEGVESGNEVRAEAESAQVATATDAETGDFIFFFRT